MIINGHNATVQFSADGVNWTSLGYAIKRLDRTFDWVSRYRPTPQGYFVSPRRAARRAHRRRMKRRG
jgi:hypothetical protein